MHFGHPFRKGRYSSLCPNSALAEKTKKLHKLGQDVPKRHSGIRPSPDPGTFTGLIGVLDPGENFEVSGLIPALENLGLVGGNKSF